MSRVATDRRPSWAADALAVGALALAFGPMALLRLVDADEGIYLFNSRLVLEGRLPYYEFHYPQMPLLPYVYAGWMRLAGVSWYGGRVLSALLAIALGIAICRHVGRVTGHLRWALLSVALFATNSLVLAWMPLVKTYALGTLALFLAYVVLEDTGSPWRFFASGLLLGLSIDTRLYVAALVPVFAVAVWRAGVRPLAGFAAGLAVALAPDLFFIAIDPANFAFNVVGHHGVRSASGLVGDLPQKLAVVLAMFGIGDSFVETELQFPLIVAAWLAFVVTTVRGRARLPLSVPIAAVLIAASLVPTPVHAQYLCMVMPFLVADATRLLASVGDAVRALAAWSRRALPYVIAALAGVYLVGTARTVHRFTVDGENVPGIFVSTEAKNWRIPAINRVARAIDVAMPVTATRALSFWPGYFVESRATSVPRLENPFTIWYSARMTPVQIAHHHFITRPEVARDIDRHAVPVVVLGNWMFDTKPFYRRHLAVGGYTLVSRVDDTEIYRWSPNGP